MTRSASARGRRGGFTLIEVVVTVAILAILATAALSLAHVTAQRTRELELRRGLRVVREGIDRFKLEYDKARANIKDAREVFKGKVTLDRTGYPLALDELVETKVLRRVPRDPMMPDGEWVTISYSDNPDSSLSDGKDVFDVRSKSQAKGLDGTTYDTW